MAEYTGGKVSYYEVFIKCPTREGREQYTAECNDIIEALGMSFSEGEAFKAIWRKAAARLMPAKKGHNGGLYDAEKAKFYGIRMELIEKHGIGKPEEKTFEPASEIDDDSPRQQITQQGGELADHVYPAVDAALAADPRWIPWQPGMKAPSIEEFTHAKRRDGAIILASRVNDWALIDDESPLEIVAYLPKQGYDE